MTATCHIDGCVSTHHHDTTVHRFAETRHEALDGKGLHVTAEYDEQSGRHTVWVGDYEFDAADVVQVVDAIVRAADARVPAVAR